MSDKYKIPEIDKACFVTVTVVGWIDARNPFPATVRQYEKNRFASGVRIDYFCCK